MSSKAAYQKRERGRKLRFDHFRKDNELVLIKDYKGLHVRLPYHSERKLKLKDPVEPKKLALNIGLLRTAKEIVRLYGKEDKWCDLDAPSDICRKYYVSHRYRMDREVRTDVERTFHKFSLIHIDSLWSEDMGKSYNFHSDLLLECEMKDILNYHTSTAWNEPQIFNPKDKGDDVHHMFVDEAMKMIEKYSAQAEKKISRLIKNN